MAKVDLKKEFKKFYAPSSKEFQLVDVPPMQYLMIDGHGDPNTATEYQQALQTLYPVAYKLKFLSKTALGKDFVVMPLEGLWWSEDMQSFISRDKDSWDWTMMILQPEWITQTMLEKVLRDEAPSMEAESKSSFGIPEMKLWSR